MVFIALMFMVKRDPTNSAEVAAAMVDSIKLVPAIAVFWIES